MTWSRFDDAARKHPKATMAGNEAWGFWCAAIMYCNQYGTDGFVPDSALATDVLPVPITKKRAVALADKLCKAKLQDDGRALFARNEVRKGYMVNDFLDWNPSKVEVESKRRAAKERKERWEGKNANGTHDGTRSGTRSEHGSERAQNEQGTESRARAPGRDPVPPARPAREEEDPPTPAEVTGARRRDPMMLSRDRLDVRELFEGWKQTFGYPKAKLDVGPYSADADTIAECVDAYGMPDCRLVLKHAPNDGMVSGRDDETKQRHNSIRYIFGNQNAFNRILREAQRAEAAALSGGVSERLERMRNQK